MWMFFVRFYSRPPTLRHIMERKQKLVLEDAFLHTREVTFLAILRGLETRRLNIAFLEYQPTDCGALGDGIVEAREEVGNRKVIVVRSCLGIEC